MPKDKNKNPAEIPEPLEELEPTQADQPIEELTPEEVQKLLTDSKALYEAYSVEHEQFVRLAAEYDNFRKRSQKEREAVYSDAKTDTVAKFLPIYDNLERALAQPTADEAYAKGVEMIAQGFNEILEKCGVKTVGEPGEVFNPEYHSAVMHVQDESLCDNVIAEVFQKGFVMGDKVIRFAMVKVAN